MDCFQALSLCRTQTFSSVFLFLEIWPLDPLWHCMFLFFIWWSEKSSCFLSKATSFYLSLLIFPYLSVFEWERNSQQHFDKKLWLMLFQLYHIHLVRMLYSVIIQSISTKRIGFIKFPAEIHIVYVYSTMKGKIKLVRYIFCLVDGCFQAVGTFFAQCYPNIYLIIYFSILPGMNRQSQ